MKEVLILLIMFLLGIQVLYAQETEFAKTAEQIANNIDSITLFERKAMKDEIKDIDAQLRNGNINRIEAKAERERIADKYAQRIEDKVNAEKANLNKLVKNRVDSNLIVSNKDSIVIKIKKNSREKGEKRTTSQFVFAFGLNTLSSENGVFPEELKVWSSRFWEFGLTRNTRLSNNSNLIHIKYGLSLVYNNLKPKDDKVFTDVDNQTVLVPSDINLKRNRFRNFYINAPIHFELDFSPTNLRDDGSKRYISHKDFRVGLGGYVGILVNSRNFFKFYEDGQKVKYSIKDDYNVNDFNYGLSAYIGYKEFSLYTKYDLQPLFKNNPTDERNFSMGIRWDLN